MKQEASAKLPTRGFVEREDRMQENWNPRYPLLEALLEHAYFGEQLLLFGPEGRDVPQTSLSTVSGGENDVGAPDDSQQRLESRNELEA